MRSAAADVALASRIVLAAALAVAAIAKLAAGRATRSQFALLLPARVAAPIAIALPVIELAIAIALVAGWSSPVPGFVAIAVLAAFTLVLVRAQLKRVPCPCFGAAGAATRPVGAPAIVRNGVLLALAVLATGDAHGARPPGTAVFALLFGAVTAAAVRAAR